MFDHDVPPPPQADLSPFVFEADDYTFSQEVIERSQHTPVLVDCWAEWCAPCRSLGPTLERLADEYQGRFALVKVNIDHAQQVAMALRVQSVPFMMLFVEGRPVDALVGNQPEPALRAFLDKHLPADESDPLVGAEERFKEGLFEEALAGYLIALEQAPHRAEALLGAARASLALGQVHEAMSYLKRVPEGDPLYETASRIQRLSSLSEHVGDEGSLRAEIEASNSVEAWYQLGATLALMGRFEEACDALLKVVMIDRSYRDDAGRVALLMIFDALGGEGEVVQRARHRLASLLF